MPARISSWTFVTATVSIDGVCDRYAYSSASPITTRSSVRMPFLKMRLSRFVAGLSLRPVGALLSTMLPARGYQGSFLRSPPHPDRSERRSAVSRRRCDPRDPYDRFVGGDDRPAVPLACRHLGVGEDVLDLGASRAAHPISGAARANDDPFRVDIPDLPISSSMHNKREAPAMPISGAPGLEGDRPVS